MKSSYANMYTSEQLFREIPHPLLNFLWYLWEVYHSKSESDFYITLQYTEGINGLHIFIPAAEVTITQEFGYNINANIIVSKIAARYFMEYC